MIDLRPKLNAPFPPSLPPPTRPPAVSCPCKVRIIHTRNSGSSQSKPHHRGLVSKPCSQVHAASSWLSSAWAPVLLTWQSIARACRSPVLQMEADTPVLGKAGSQSSPALHCAHFIPTGQSRMLTPNKGPWFRDCRLSPYSPSPKSSWRPGARIVLRCSPLAWPVTDLGRGRLAIVCPQHLAFTHVELHVHNYAV